MMDEQAELKAEYEKIKNSNFKQQNLLGFRVNLSDKTMMIIYFGLGAFLIVIGIISLQTSGGLNEIVYRYDEECKKNYVPGSHSCRVELIIENDMEKEVMIYYQLDGFYQNHRRYIKSRSADQLYGKKITFEEMKNSQDCDPYITNDEMNKHSPVTGDKPLHGGEVAIPCGLMAKSYFNDTYKNWQVNDEIIFPNEKNITLQEDRDFRFKNHDLSEQWIDMTDEHFIVWMRPAGKSNFRKLWGRIEQDLKKGDKVSLVIVDNYDVSSFEGKKYLILSNVNSLGGKNVFIGASYIFIGSIILIFGIVLYFGIKYHSKLQAI